MIEMTHKHIILASAVALLMAGCIREEAPNAEADITCCTLPEGYILDKEIDYYAGYDNTIHAFPLDITVRDGVGLTSLSPCFELTPGATIEPASGSTHDFSNPVRYKVTSEDRKWSKEYSVCFHYRSQQDFPLVMHLDSAETESGFHTFHDGIITWCSGNRGFRLVNTGAAPDMYPTVYSPDGYSNGCAVLTTRATGSLGEMAGMPIAAGNLFIGTFDILNAMKDALAATKFGTTYTHKPLAVEGWYKYTPGPKFYEDGQYTDRVDHGNMNAIFFETDDNVKMLDGHADTEGWNHPAMVALASMPEIPVTTEWTHFRLEFDYDRYGHGVDPDKLAAGRYSISLIFSSSAGGGEFEGAPGSTLMLDEIRIINE